MVADEAFRMDGVGSGQDGGARVADGLGATVVDGFRGAQAEAGVTVLGVVPGEEVAAEGAGILDGAEARREAGSILEGPELRLRVRVVVALTGRECVLSTPRSVSSRATGFEVIDEPRAMTAPSP